MFEYKKPVYIELYIMKSILNFTSRLFLKLFDWIYNLIKDIFINLSGLNSEKDFISRELNKIFSIVVASFVIFFTVFVVGFSILITPNPTTKVPNVVGEDVIAGLIKLQANKLTFNIETIISEKHPKGIIIRQIPSPGNIVREGKIVKLFVSIGAGEFEMPDLKGLHLEEAKSILISKGGIISKIEYVQDNFAPENTVVKTLPVEGTKLKPNSPIILYLSSGSTEGFPMPNLVGMNFENAMLSLYDKKVSLVFTPMVVDNSTSDGKIIDQIPKENELVKQGDRVELFVGVFGNEEVSSITRFLMYSFDLKDYVGSLPEETTIYEVKLVITDQSGEKTLLRQFNSPSIVLVPLRVQGIASIKVYLNNNLIREDKI